MKTSMFSGIRFSVNRAIIPLAVGMMLLITTTTATFFEASATANLGSDDHPPRINGLAKNTLAAKPAASQPYPVELKLDRLPAGMGGALHTQGADNAAAATEMLLDDGQLEMAFGFDNGTNAYQFIWFNRFTPQASDFPFMLNEIWLLFDNTTIDANINLGDEIELIVYSDEDNNPANGATYLESYSSEIMAVDGVTWSSYLLSPPTLLEDPGDVLIGVINHYTISGVSDPSYPAAIDTTTSQERSYLGWWTADPPDPPELPPDGFLELMTGENAGNWLIRGYGGPFTTYVYLPHIVKDAVPPSTPTLYDIENADGDGAYTINWSTSSQATGYTLQEDDNADFTNPTVIYTGPDTSKALNGKSIADYYYRIRAENGTVFSTWSSTKMVSVTQVPELICETHNFGTGGSSLLIPTTGSYEHFTAENNMVVETLEVKSNMKALFPTSVYVAVGINAVRLASTTHLVSGNAWWPYYLKRTNLTGELHVGDDIYYYIARTGDTSAYLGWDNYVKLCGR